MDKDMKIAIGSDHAGFAMKEAIEARLRASGRSVEDFGTDVLRRITLHQPDTDVKKIVEQCLNQWKKRFVLKE